MGTKIIKLKDFEIGGDKLTILAGPCAAESMEILDETASGLKEITTKLGINFVFKCSSDKYIYSANPPGMIFVDLKCLHIE
mgnify:CR=1 FL=1